MKGLYENNRGKVFILLAVLTSLFLIFIYFGQVKPSSTGWLYKKFLIKTKSSSSIESLSYPMRKHSVACMISTMPSTWDTKAKAVRNTWSPRCHLSKFFYSYIHNCSYPICKANNTVAFNITEGRHYLTAKTNQVIVYMYQTYGKSIDWYLKADDDTYVIWENLLKLLSKFDPNSPRYLGMTSITDIPRGFNSGGAGYVLSKTAVELMIKKGFPEFQDCNLSGYMEDLNVAKCLSKLGIYPEKTSDPEGKKRFASQNPIRVLEGNPQISPYRYINYNGVEFGNKQAKLMDEMLSNESISFHYVTPAEMYMFDFLLYKLSL